MVKYPDFIDAMSPAPRKRSWWRVLGRQLPGLLLAFMVTLLTATVLYPYVIITVPSGQVGVLMEAV